MKKAYVGLCVCLGAMLVPGLASAQTDALPSDQSEASGLGDIIVTAQRRSENIQNVPVAITAATAEDLSERHVFNVADIGAISPSVAFQVGVNPATTAVVSIRGIGTAGSNRAFEGAVGIFIDGVYRTRAGQALSTWLDVDGVQVLRGPQGTLFGKNTTAGALLINSVSPTTDEIKGTFELSYGNLDTQIAKAAINLPLGEKAALRIAGSMSNTDGPIRDPNTGRGLNDDHPRSVKAQLLVKPTEDLRIRLIGDYTSNTNSCCFARVESQAGTTRSFIKNVLVPASGLKAPSENFDDYEAVLSRVPIVKIEDKGIALNIDYDTPSGLSFKSITAYRKFKALDSNADTDGTAGDVVYVDLNWGNEFFSQEFNVSGRVGPAELVGGIYYSNERISGLQTIFWGNQAQQYFDFQFGAGTTVAPPGPVQTEILPGRTKSYAVFAQANIDLTDKLTAIIGGRYSYDDKRGRHIRSFFTSIPNNPLRTVRPGPEYNAHYTGGAVSGTLGLQYQFSPNLMAYATYSRGYKSGGVNLDNNAAGVPANDPANGGTPLDPRYRPEYIDGFELGVKSTYFDRRARSNFAFFYSKMSDFQVAVFNGLQYSVINGDAKSYGLEIENSFQPVDVLTLNADLTWLIKAEFGVDARLGQLSGRDFDHAPRLTVNLGASLDQPVSDKLSLTGRLSVEYSGKQYTNTGNAFQRPGETEINASFGFKTDSGLSLNAWVNNLTDRRYAVLHGNASNQPGTVHTFVSMPRTYGITLQGTF